jgi:Protein of unknown function (DUF1244)
MTTTMINNYVESYLPPSIVEKLEAGAWKSLCNHLRQRSDEVQNIDLMTVSGFCRNCLAKASGKWLCVWWYLFCCIMENKLPEYVLACVTDFF